MTNYELTPGNVKAAMQGLKSSDLWQVPYADLYILEGFNVREPSADLQQHVQNLAALMVANGYDRDKPMSGYVASIDGVNRIVVTDGHNRYKAIAIARDAGAEIDTVPVVTKMRGTTMEDLTVALATSNSGRPLSPWELGAVFKRLQGFGWDEKQVAQKLNYSVSYVADLLFLQSCPQAVRDMVRGDFIAAGPAIAAVKKHGDKAGDVLQAAVDKASAAGKTKATAKDIPPTKESLMKKAGPKLHEALMWVVEDEAYCQLSDATREHLENLLATIPSE
jgi:ParB family chromosome partitioning protein